MYYPHGCTHTVAQCARPSIYCETPLLDQAIATVVALSICLLCLQSLQTHLALSSGNSASVLAGTGLVCKRAVPGGQ